MAWQSSFLLSLFDIFKGGGGEIPCAVGMVQEAETIDATTTCLEQNAALANGRVGRGRNGVARLRLQLQPFGCL